MLLYTVDVISTIQTICKYNEYAQGHDIGNNWLSCTLSPGQSTSHIIVFLHYGLYVDV